VTAPATGSDRLAGAACGLGAAALFGVSTPLAKLLLMGEAGPLLLAAILYLGAGIALVAWGLAVRAVGRRAPSEARLRGSDVVPMLAIIVAGGALGPVLMLDGLSRVSAVSGALLLNLEGPFTILLAVAVFREHLGARAGAAAALVIGGAAVLGYRPGEWRTGGLGALEIAGACACWALDNNLMQRLSLRDPVSIARLKALGAGACTLALALGLGYRPSSPGVLLPGLAVGAVCFGASIVLDVYALRLLGAAREAAFFATAPFVGALAALPLLGERLGPSDGLAMAIMAGGVALLLRERHGHLHAHEEMEHDHVHVHDEHHRHAHDGPVTEPHAHPHRHAPLVHDHPHVSDLHHRHRH
jgi:drug/metabolite transporter (DMT)-like permease